MYTPLLNIAGLVCCYQEVCVCGHFGVLRRTIRDICDILYSQATDIFVTLKYLSSISFICDLLSQTQVLDLQNVIFRTQRTLRLLEVPKRTALILLK